MTALKSLPASLSFPPKGPAQHRGRRRDTGSRLPSGSGRSVALRQPYILPASSASATAKGTVRLALGVFIAIVCSCFVVLNK